MQSWFFSFVLCARAHCNPSCLCLAPFRASCSCRSCLCLLLYLCLACSLCSSFLTSLSRVLLHSCFFLLTWVLVCALPLFRFPLCRCCSATSVHCRYCAHDCAALCSLRARVLPAVKLIDAVLGTVTNSSGPDFSHVHDCALYMRDTELPLYHAREHADTCQYAWRLSIRVPASGIF